MRLFTAQELFHFRSGRPKMFCRKGFLKKILKNFTRKYVSFLIKLQASARQLCLKKRALVQVFPVKFAKFRITCFFKERLRWLLLSMSISTDCGSYDRPDPDHPDHPDHRSYDQNLLRLDWRFWRFLFPFPNTISESVFFFFAFATIWVNRFRSQGVL